MPRSHTRSAQQAYEDLPHEVFARVREAKRLESAALRMLRGPGGVITVYAVNRARDRQREADARLAYAAADALRWLLTTPADSRGDAGEPS